MAEPEEFRAKDRETWREWLNAHHDTRAGVWLVFSKKGSGIPSISYEAAVEEALCFGWIDSKAAPLDDKTYRQYFSLRKNSSPWSSSNKVRVERLIADGRMMPAGWRAIEAAKASGMWNALDAVEALETPQELLDELARVPGARENFDAWSRSDRRVILQWIALARRPETRSRRIVETAEFAGRNEKPGPLAYEKRRRQASAEASRR